MPGIDKATGRVAALIVLVVLAAVSLRGYLPDERRREPSPAGPASSLAAVAVLSAALGIVVVALIARLRDPRTSAGNLTGLAEGVAGRGARPRWQAVLVGLAVILAWLLIVMVLEHWVGRHGVAQQPLDRAPPTPTPPPDTHPRRPRPAGGAASGYLTAGVVVLALMIGVAGVARARRHPRAMTSAPAERPEPDAAAPDADVLVRAAELALAQVGDRGRGPRAAIIACYAAMERELAHVPDAVPQEYDTATEVLARAVEHRALHADNAAELVRLFTEARFSPHVMTEEHRDAAAHVLELVLAELARGPG